VHKATGRRRLSGIADCIARLDHEALRLTPPEVVGMA